MLARAAGSRSPAARAHRRNPRRMAGVKKRPTGVGRLTGTSQGRRQRGGGGIAQCIRAQVDAVFVDGLPRSCSP